jgi:hypothetical protein
MMLHQFRHNSTHYVFQYFVMIKKKFKKNFHVMCEKKFINKLKKFHVLEKLGRK